LIEISAPVGHVEHGEYERENNTGDDIDAFRTQRVRAYPGTTTRFCLHPIVSLLSTITTIFHEDDFGTGWNQGFLK
jgi:hypothetical protein